MKKINHSKEIKTTRVGGFGGSDAAMVLEISERISTGQQLTTTQKHRLLQLKGLETRPEFDSPEIQAGRAFEDEVAKRLKKEDWDRETFLQPLPNTTMAVRKNFRVFAHADFYNPKTNTVTECKWSRKFNHDGLEKRYQAQLQWYYMLGADAVCLCSDTADGRKTTDVARDDMMVEILKISLETIDEVFPNIDLTIREKSCDELPPKVAKLIAEIETITKTMAQEEETLKAKKAELLAYLIGVSRTVAAEYTFYLAIPVMFGASLLKILKFGFSFTAMEAAILLVGMVVAFVVSMFVIKFLMGYIKKHDFKVFGWYRIILGIIVLACGIAGVIG